MIHLNKASGHECLTEEEFEFRYPELHASINRPRPWEKVGRMLRQERMKSDISVRELAKHMNVRPSYLSEHEFGRVDITDKFIGEYFESIREIKANDKATEEK
jgi:ribosome-binding protein aMBF1 (putative translation factor)